MNPHPVLTIDSGQTADIGVIRVNRVIVATGLGLLLVLASAFAGPGKGGAFARSIPGEAVAREAIAAPVAPPVGKPIESIPSPRHYSVQLQVMLKPDDQLAALLVRAGAAQGDAEQAGALVEPSLSAEGETEVTIFLGDKVAEDARRLEQVSLRPGFDRRLAVTRQGGALTLMVEEIDIDATPLRISGRVGDGLFWSLRAAGATPEIAEAYLAAVTERLGASSDLDPDDRFDVIVERRRTSGGERDLGTLQYAGLDRARGADLNLVRWSLGAGAQWVSPDERLRRPARLALPVAGAVTSRFGNRVHPIFRTVRFHKGIDLRAAWGTPVHAAADGQVIGAGWSGGHGLRVRVAHPGDLATSYSHLSRIAAVPGRMVRRGELLGYVGSTGFSTGAHLHFEMLRHNRPVDPLGVHMDSATALSAADRVALRARLAQLLTVPIG